VRNKVNKALLQVAVEAAKKLEGQAQKQAEELQQEKTALELEASDLRRQCTDLQQKASTLTVRNSTGPLTPSMSAERDRHTLSNKKELV